jgi:hypothetical protein
VLSSALQFRLSGDASEQDQGIDVFRGTTLFQLLRRYLNEKKEKN